MPAPEASASDAIAIRRCAVKRVPEPELMDEPEQAEAYANADFEEPHSRIIEWFDAEFPGIRIKGSILDLGCGPGDVTFRFGRRFPEATITAVDGSAAMIGLANERGGPGTRGCGSD